MTTINEQGNEMQHQPIEKTNGCTVCTCGFGDNDRFVPYFGEGTADMFRQASSRDEFWAHLRGVAMFAKDPA